MSCDEWLAGYSGYLDELLDAGGMESWRLHANECAGCGRYDRVVRGGLLLVRNLDDVAGKPEFGVRLGRRLRAWELSAMRPSRAPLLAGSVLVAAAIVFAAGSGWGAGAESDAARAEVVTTGQQLVDPASPPWWAGNGVPSALVRDGQARVSDRSVMFPGPYSPLVVEEPLSTRATFVRLASQGN
jgi:hypothetical protein